MAQGKRPALDFTRPPPGTIKKPKIRTLFNSVFVCKVDGERPTGKYMWNCSIPAWTCSAEKGQQIVEQMKDKVLQQGNVDWRESADGKQPYIQATFYTPMGLDIIRNAFHDAARPGLSLGPTRDEDQVVKPTLHLSRVGATPAIYGDTKHLLAYFPMYGGEPQEDKSVLFSGDSALDLPYIRSNTIQLTDTMGYGLTFDAEMHPVPPSYDWRLNDADKAEEAEEAEEESPWAQH